MDDAIRSKLVCPTPPNFISLDIPGLVMEGMSDTPRVRVSDLTTEQKDWLATEWRSKLDEVAERQIDNPEPVHRGD